MVCFSHGKLVLIHAVPFSSTVSGMKEEQEVQSLPLPAQEKPG